MRWRFCWLNDMSTEDCWELKSAEPGHAQHQDADNSGAFRTIYAMCWLLRGTITNVAMQGFDQYTCMVLPARLPGASCAEASSSCQGGKASCSAVRSLLASWLEPPRWAMSSASSLRKPGLRLEAKAGKVSEEASDGVPAHWGPAAGGGTSRRGTTGSRSRAWLDCQVGGRGKAGQGAAGEGKLAAQPGRALGGLPRLRVADGAGTSGRALGGRPRLRCPATGVAGGRSCACS